MSILQIFLYMFIGAVIGYLTNYIAIKMIFKPHKTYYIFKIRVPFTPGIIPKKRERIAHNIGRIVGEMLLDESTIRQKITSQSTKELVIRTVGDNLIKLKNYEVNTLSELIPQDYYGKFEEFLSQFKIFLRSKIEKYLKSEYFENTIREIVDKEFSKLGEIKINNIIEQDKLESFLIDFLSNIVNNDIFIDNILNSIENYFDNLFEREETLENYLPEGTINFIIAAIKKLVPKLLPYLGKLLVNEDVKSFLYKGIKEIIMQLINDMNIIQKIMINLIKINSIIDKEAPPLVDKFIEKLKSTLENKETIKKALNSIDNVHMSIKDKPVKEILKDVNKEKYIEIKLNIKKETKYLIKNEEITVKALSKNIIYIINNIGKKTINEIMIGYSPDLSENLKNKLIKKLIEVAQSDKIMNGIINFIYKNIDFIVNEMKIGKLENYFNITQEKELKLKNFISDIFLTTLDKQTPNILDALNLQTMVKNKIDEFPVSKVEDIVLTVINNELKYINIFGAIIGALIGSANFAINNIIDKIFS